MNSESLPDRTAVLDVKVPPLVALFLIEFDNKVGYPQRQCREPAADGYSYKISWKRSWNEGMALPKHEPN
jgi:hypothetical protein